jgi:hypothetical protein
VTPLAGGVGHLGPGLLECDPRGLLPLGEDPVPLGLDLAPVLLGLGP